MTFLLNLDKKQVCLSMRPTGNAISILKALEDKYLG